MIGEKTATNIFDVKVIQAMVVLIPCRAASLISTPTTDGSRYSRSPVTMTGTPIKMPRVVAPRASVHHGSGPAFSAARSSTGTASQNAIGKCTRRGCRGTPNATLGSLITA